MDLVAIIYLGIGLILMLYWWDKYDRQSYEEAKKSEFGEENGMVELVLLFSLFFWPLVLAYRLLRR